MPIIQETAPLNETVVSGGRLEDALARVQPGIEILDNSNLDLTDADLSRLIETVRETAQGRLREWRLQGNAINDTGAQRLAVFLASACPSLEVLTLEDNPVGDSGRSALVSGLALLRKKLKIIA
jgi:Ran GTPase-activating protein (RanGAP) involved in mRNA processing and transport